MTNTTDIDAAMNIPKFDQKAMPPTTYFHNLLEHLEEHEQTILAALEHYKAPQWMPIETLKNSDIILLYHKFFQYDCVEEGRKSSSGRFYNVKGTEVFPTHWMPLPTLPKGD